MAFTAADVKNLREMTGVGMMDCKKALTETDGDMDKAVEYLREKGLAKAAKKAGRIAAEGVSYALVENGVGALVEVNCETDFCAKSAPFVAFVKDIAKVVADYRAALPEADIYVYDNNSTDHTDEIARQAGAIVRYAKETGTSTFIVGHVTKEGSLAGPRILEHMVDAVLYFEGDRQHEYRLLRAVKNRFGSVNELGVFEMRSEGMIPVPNPSETLLSQRARGAGGSVVFCTLQGSRPILCDLQALAAKSFYSVPKRTVGGMDSSRVALLLAVMEKRAGKKLFDQDVYINVAGGLALSDPAADLAVCVAVASSLMGFALSPSLSVMGEVGLCGEVRPVSQAERRVAECVRLGFTEILLPKQNMKSIKPIEGVRLTGVDTLMQALAVVTD